MNDKERWTLSFGGALLIYALLFTAAVFITIETRFETAAVAVELRLPSLPDNNGEKKSEQLPLRKSVSAAVRPAVAAVGQPAVNTESNASVPATTETGRGQIPSRVSADGGQSGEQRPQIDFVSASAGVVLPMPGYPAAARRKGIEGFVTVRMTVGSDGVVTETEVIHASHEWFRRAVLSAISRWHFPPRKGGFVTEKKFVFCLED